MPYSSPVTFPMMLGQTPVRKKSNDPRVIAAGLAEHGHVRLDCDVCRRTAEHHDLPNILDVVEKTADESSTPRYSAQASPSARRVRIVRDTSQGAPMQENFATALEVVADQVGDATAIIHGERRETWAELEDRAARLAGALASEGVGHGDRVAIGLYNGVEFLETIFAIMKLRATPVNLNYRYRERELRHVLDSSQATAVVYDTDLEERLETVGRGLPRLRTFVRFGDTAGGGPTGAIDLHDALRDHAPAEREPRGDDEWLLYTGGTTGMPKGVRAPHSWLFGVTMGSGYALLGEAAPADLDELAERTRAIADRDDGLTAVVSCPLMHGTGIFSSLGVLATGGTVVLLPSRSFDAAVLARETEVHRATDMVIVGDAFARPLADALEQAAAEGRPYDLSALRRIRSIGALWSADVKHRLLEHCDAELVDTIAASEGGPFAASVTTRGEHSVTSRFVLAPGARVLDETGRDVVAGSGEVGMLAAPADDRIEYLDDPDATEKTYRTINGERWCVPGDLASLEADGSLVFRGRGSRVINSGGEKIFCEEVEEVLGLHRDIADAYVVGVPDERFGQRIAAVIEIREGAELSSSEVVSFVREHLADFKQPRDITFVPKLQRQLTGKADLKWAVSVATGVESATTAS
jgi:3-oxocholest-4-en-26-oate---CoA ligase